MGGGGQTDNQKIVRSNTNAYVRNLELARLNITLPIFCNNPTQPLARYHFFYRRIMQRLPLRYTSLLYFFLNIPHLGASPKLLEKFTSHYTFHPRTYFTGFFMDTIYFNDIKSILHKEFRPKSTSHKTAQLQKQIASTQDSVFLHIRIGDFLLSQNWKYTKLGSAYYNGSLRLIIQKLKNPTIFVFSDDLAWCKASLLSYLDADISSKAKFIFIGNGNQANAIEDLLLMYSCQHAIVANSTFSFWGAYLINNPQKIICAPAQYVWSGEGSEWYPKSWHKIDVHWGYELP